jgi:phage-related protein
MKLDFINSMLLEARTGGIAHPEDSVFAGSAAAQQNFTNMVSLIKHPESISIKWDGFPALIFGIAPSGKFSIMDKYMFDANVFATSPADWQHYDSQKASGKTRPDLYAKLAAIWAGLAEAVGSSPGFFWGDLLWAQRLPVVNGRLVFKPNVVEYRIPVTSQLGQRIKNTTGGIVVHQYFPSADIKQAQTWNGQGLNNNGSVAILNPTMNIKFKLSDPHNLVKQATALLKKAPAIDKFLAGLDNPARAALEKYMNHRVRGKTQDDLATWLQTNVSGKQYKLLVGDNGSGYLQRARAGLEATLGLWQAIYNLKLELVQELESQVQSSGLEQYVDNKPQGEGFVFQTPQGLGKLVNKGVFTAAALG